MKTKRSHSLSIRSLRVRLAKIIATLSADRVTVYASQASFFTFISTLPLIMLLLSLSRYVLPDRIYDVIISLGESLPGGVRPLFMALVDEVYARPAVKLISLTALVTLWSASRGIGAIRDGVATVYNAPQQRGFFKKAAVTLLYTAVFIVLIVALIVLLLFGEQLFAILSSKFSVLLRFYELFKYRTGIIFAALVLFFNLIYYTAGRRGHSGGSLPRHHLPGAVVAAGGWVLFSYFYSLYTMYFSRMSYIYGSLTAIILLMLWLYFCMIILLCGAEFNKLCAVKRRAREKA